MQWGDEIGGLTRCWRYLVTQPSAGQLLIWTDNASRGDGGEGEGCVGRRRIRMEDSGDKEDSEDKEDSGDNEDKELR